MPIEEFVDAAGPFRGMRWAHAFDPDPAYCEVIKNGYPLDPINGGPVTERPAIRRGPSTAFGTGSDNIQLFVTTWLGGNDKNVVIADGEIHLWDSVSTKSTEVTAANFTTAGITFSATAKRVWAVTLNDRLIVSDGVNTPFQWDGTAGAGGLVSLTNCPVLYGQPVIYYAKLFGIKNTERDTIVWSEENDPTTGYEAGGFNNSWELSQTGFEPLVGLKATNEALYFARTSSIGSVRGAVTSTFVSDGTLDGISTELGIVSKDSWLLYGNQIWFVDQFYRPQFFFTGSIEIIPIWKDLAVIFSPDSPTTSLGMGVGSVDDISDIRIGGTDDPMLSSIPGTDLVVFCYGDTVETAADEASHFFVYDRRTLQLQGWWRFPHPVQRVGTFPFTNWEFVVGTLSGFGMHMDVTAYPGATPTTDHDDTGTVIDITMEIIGPLQFNAHDFDFHFDRVDLLHEPFSSLDIGIGYYTPSKVRDSTSMTTQRVRTAVGQKAGGFTIEEHTGLGLSGDGRWFKLYLTTVDNPGFNAGRMQLLGWTVTAFPMQRHPASR